MPGAGDVLRAMSKKALLLVVVLVVAAIYLVRR
jgi:hypothetical protein